MNFRKITGGLLSLCMLASVCPSSNNGILTTAVNAAENETEAVEKLNEFSPEMITGVWEGTYSGHSKGTVIERTISLNISECSENGEFSGIATVTSAEGVSYIFSGTYDTETGVCRMSGTEWVENNENWGFAEFEGTYDSETETVSGLVDNAENKTFSLKKTSDTYEPCEIDTDIISREWYGEYDGHSGSVVVRRNYKISITDIAEDGTVKGKAVFSPSDKAASKYALDGSYYFSGTIDRKYGIIKIQGNEWIEHPSMENFSFVKLTGYIRGNVINGSSEDGIWRMESTDIVKGDINFDNNISSEDLLNLYAYYWNEYEFNDTLHDYADLNNDGDVNIIDVILMKNMILERMD